MKPLIITLMALGLVLSLQYTNNETKQVKVSPTAVKAVVQAIAPIKAAKVVFKATYILPKPVEAAPVPVVVAPPPVVVPPPLPVVQPTDWYKAWIYNEESGNDPTRWNSSGCLGIAQACPASKLLAVCPTMDYNCEDSFFTNYMLQRYGSWQAAYEFHIAHNWW